MVKQIKKKAGGERFASQKGMIYSQVSPSSFFPSAEWTNARQLRICRRDYKAGDTGVEPIPRISIRGIPMGPIFEDSDGKKNFASKRTYGSQDGEQGRVDA